ncbi:MAG TPA: ATP-binding protein [Acetobacteraceae bacterium]|nr:ATP-binding protein [Acetobacteraceae bacterium]
MFTVSGFVSGFALAALLSGAVALRARQRMARAEAARREVAAAEAAATRLLRLAANEIRAPALTLRGHAGLQATPGAAGTLALLSSRLITLSEDLLEQTSQAGARRVLNEEVVTLTSELDAAITEVATALAPGRRNWRVSGALAGVTLLADRRALHLILTRVLANAAHATREQDWIEIGAERQGGNFAVVIVDEGEGLVGSSAAPVARDSRGIGYSLSLARSLIQAHGGNLLVESEARVGTRVTLIFPAERLKAAGKSLE